jgi:hypothetical protein
VLVGPATGIGTKSADAVIQEHQVGAHRAIELLGPDANKMYCHQEAAPEEIAAIGEWLKREGTCLLLAPQPLT